MSPLLAAVLVVCAPPMKASPSPIDELSVKAPDTKASAEATQAAGRTGPELRDAVRVALRRWARPTDAQAESAAREFIALYRELRADDKLAQSQRGYFAGKVRGRLIQLSEQISKRIAREERLAKNQRTGTLTSPAKSESTSRQQDAGDSSATDYVPGTASGGPARGGGAMQSPDYGPQLVELIQRVIRPESWDVNGGPGSIYYWYPGRALVIRQTQEVHEDIGGAVEQLRRAGR